MILMPVNWQDVFVEKDTVAGVEVFMLFGFLSILLFDLLVIFRSLIRKARKRMVSPLDSRFLTGGIACIFALILAKVMADEVGREIGLELKLGEEFVLLNVLLLIQIIYNIYFARWAPK
jgi:hypothetical protein